MAELFAAAPPLAGRWLAGRWPPAGAWPPFDRVSRARAGRPRTSSRHLAKRLILHSLALLALPADRPYDDLRLVPR